MRQIHFLDDLSFERSVDGTVQVVRSVRFPDGIVRQAVGTFSPEQWTTIIAEMSSAGGSDFTKRVAHDLHMGQIGFD